MPNQRSSRIENWPWDPPSPRVREIIRAGAELILRAPVEWFDEFDRASLDREPMKEVADDPALSAAIRRTNRATLFDWATANVRDPGAPVTPTLGPDSLGIARSLVRRGLGERALAGYRVGQNLAWLRWMELVFGLTSDAQELRAVLDVSARSIGWFIDATLAGIKAQMEVEHEELTHGTQTARLEVVTLVLEGAPISTQSASQRLGYGLDQFHRAAIVWSDEPDSDLGALESTAEAFARSVGAQRPLTVVASAATIWAWVPSKAEPALNHIHTSLLKADGVRIATGSLGRGVEGFRRSHLDALTAQKMLARLGSSERFVAFDAVRLVALVTQNTEGASSFVQHTLGDLVSAPAETRDALRVFLGEGSNASQAATLLRTHRNTLLRRLSRAEELLPRPLEGNRLHVAVALEVLRWK